MAFFTITHAALAECMGENLHRGDGIGDPRQSAFGRMLAEMSVGLAPLRTTWSDDAVRRTRDANEFFVADDDINGTPAARILTR